MVCFGKQFYSKTTGKEKKFKVFTETVLAVQWLRLHAPNTGGMGLIPSQGTKIPHVSLPPQPAKKKKKSKRVRAEDSTTERGL